MEVYKNTSDLRPGLLLLEDVYVKTNYPIIRKQTTLTSQHLDVLRAFGIHRVKVEERIVPDQALTEDIEDLALIPDVLPSSLEFVQKQYLEAIRGFKKEFDSWRSGKRPDVANVRKHVMPVIELFLDNKSHLASLNELSSPKDYVYHHAVSVGILAAALSNQLGYSKGDALQLGLAGTLADAGMAKISPKIIEKTAFLSKQEYIEIKKHVIYSYQMIKDTPLLRNEMKVAIFQHHERLDGSGYPRGDKADAISQYAQVLAVADVFHAMTTERVYRSKQSPYKVIEMIKEEEFGKFDLQVVDALLNLIASFSIGMSVKLTSGDIGEIIFIHRDFPLRPMIRKKDGTLIDLSRIRKIAIEKVFN